MVNTVCTLYELTNGDDTAGQGKADYLTQNVDFDLL